MRRIRSALIDSRSYAWRPGFGSPSRLFNRGMLHRIWRQSLRQLVGECLILRRFAFLRGGPFSCFAHAGDPAAECRQLSQHSEIAANLLIALGADSADFPERPLKEKPNCSDLQSAPFATRDTLPHVALKLCGDVRNGDCPSRREFRGACYHGGWMQCQPACRSPPEPGFRAYDPWR